MVSRVNSVGRPKNSRKAEGAPVAARAPKAPSDEQYVKMAGAMANALERLRVFYQTIVRAREVSGQNGMVDGAIVLGRAESQAMLDEVTSAANILRVGLKARANRGANR